MAYTHPTLSAAVRYHFKDSPHLAKGITLVNRDKQGMVLEFLHPDIGPFPTDADLAQWVAEYEALPPDDAAKDPKAAQLKRFDALGNGLQELKDFIRAELL